MARRRPSSIYLADVGEREISWASEGYFPRGVISSLYAPRNTGKTLSARGNEYLRVSRCRPLG